MKREEEGGEKVRSLLSLARKTKVIWVSLDLVNRNVFLTPRKKERGRVKGRTNFSPTLKAILLTSNVLYTLGLYRGIQRRKRNERKEKRETKKGRKEDRDNLLEARIKDFYWPVKTH